MGPDPFDFITRRKKNMNALSILFFSIISLMPFMARADEKAEYLKFTCIPEIGYMELTSMISYDKIPVEDYEKLGIFLPKKNPICIFPQYNLTVEFELKEHATQKSPCYSSRWYTVNVKINGTAIKSFEYFGSQCPIYTGLEDGIRSAYAPHLLAYQIFGSHYIHACTGKGRRTCESFEINARKLEEILK
ncbi:MAG: hypothetical protein HYU57_01505 [Micavibrio aeruginosavorus]|nr:hypothetical protein [Micavibrio aeruginosavorus]